MKRQEPSRIQKWVSELEYRQGLCTIQSLMHHALNQGITAGNFFKEFQQNLEEKKISEDRTGKVSLL